jgi:hypothetical protein
VEVFDRLVKSKEIGGTALPSRRTGKRSIVAGITKPARNRLLKTLAMVARTDCCAFVTLTTHFCETEWEESKNDFHRFRNNLQQRYPEVCGVWRFAWQTRGAAHYHLLFWGFGEDESQRVDFEASLHRIWLKATGEQGDAASRKHAVDAVFVHDFRACGFYLALYQSDQTVTNHDEKESGRTWGIIRRSELDLRPKLVFELTDYQAQYVRRVLRNVRRVRQLARTGKRQRKGYGPLARRSGSFSSFLPVEESSRLFAYVVKHVDASNRVVSTRLDLPMVRVERDPW